MMWSPQPARQLMQWMQANAIDLDSGDDEPSMVSQASRQPTQSQSRLNLGGRRLPASLSQPGASQSKARLVRR